MGDILFTKCRPPCVPAPNIDPFRRPTMTPVGVAFSTMLQLVKHFATGSTLDADWGDKQRADTHSNHQGFATADILHPD